ncbi:MAG: hypothetical protein IJ566_05095, partial [Cardiobacteriaceae bacterium]|nr:hypothetical protein [Cardiobacteriaceae bacterium]
MVFTVILSRRQKIYRQILRFAQDDGSSIWLFYRHFERSEKSIDSSFASLRMTAAVFGGFTVILSRRRKIYRRSFASFRMTGIVCGFTVILSVAKNLTVTVIFATGEKSLDNGKSLFTIALALLIKRIFLFVTGNLYEK